MRIPEPHDYGQDRVEVWLERLRRIRPRAQFVLDLFHSLFLVAFTMLIGGMAGALMGGRWGDTAFWYGMAGGGASGMLLGIFWAKRAFFGRPGNAPPAAPARLYPRAGAYRWPGVEERFSRMRVRGLVLMLLMGAALLAMAWLGGAGERIVPVPPSMPAMKPDLILLGCIAALAALLALNSRCPKCRRFLWRALELRQCPHCRVVLRSFEP